MAAELTLLVNFALLLVAAELGSLLFALLRLPRVVGMLAGGILIGPGVNPYAGALSLDAENVRDIAFLGSIFLMFSIGLTFSPGSFRGVSRPAILVALFAGFASFVLGFGIARFFGLGQETSLFVGLLLAPTSSTVGLRLAHDMNLLGQEGVDTTMAAIVYDDVVALVIATVVIATLSPERQGGFLHVSLTLTVVLVLAFFIILVGIQAMPRALDLFERFRQGNPALIIMSFALFMAYLFTLLRLPPIFGAFWAGSMIASSRYGTRMRTFLNPVTELFSAVFFAAMGLLLVPRLVRGLAMLVLALVAAGILAKVVCSFLSLRAFRIPVYSALMCSTLLVPRGEISLVIAQYASEGVNPQKLQALGVLLMLGTSLAAPLLANGIRSAFVARSRRRLALPAP